MSQENKVEDAYFNSKQWVTLKTNLMSRLSQHIPPTAIRQIENHCEELEKKESTIENFKHFKDSCIQSITSAIVPKKMPGIQIMFNILILNMLFALFMWTLFSFLIAPFLPAIASFALSYKIAVLTELTWPHIIGASIPTGLAISAWSMFRLYQENPRESQSAAKACINSLSMPKQA